MDTGVTPRSLRAFVIISLVSGVLGGALFWWVPLGMVLSLNGLVFGIIDWTMARSRSLNSRLSVVAILLCAAALCLCVVIALLGLQTVTFRQLGV